MHFNDEGELNAKYTAFMHEVENERLARKIIAARRRPAKQVHQPILVWLGNHMIVWGWRLRARYSSLES
jgi:hypothetical protein